MKHILIRILAIPVVFIMTLILLLISPIVVFWELKEEIGAAFMIILNTAFRRLVDATCITFEAMDYKTYVIKKYKRIMEEQQLNTITGTILTGETLEIDRYLNNNGEWKYRIYFNI